MRSTIAVVPALVVSAWLAPGTPAPSRVAERARAADDILARSRALYPSLKSYADSGTVVEENTGYIGRAKFRTRFRQPRDFYFEYRGVGSEYSSGVKAPSPTHIVLWMSGGDLERWNAELRSHDVFPAAGAQVSAVAGTGAITSGTAVLIPSLIFVKAGLVGTIQEMGNFSLAGTEDVRGHKCHKLVGVARSVYPSGQVVNVRPAAVWIDVKTLLIRKVFTDTPKGYPMGRVSRLTITIDPQPNPPLGDDKFRFAVPEAQ